jgi:hypothetical protein
MKVIKLDSFYYAMSSYIDDDNSLCIVDRNFSQSFLTTYTSTLEASIINNILIQQYVTSELNSITDANRNTLENGIVCVGAIVHPGDILVDKKISRNRAISAEEKLLSAVLGSQIHDQDQSLRVPDWENREYKVTHVNISDDVPRKNGANKAAEVNIQVELTWSKPLEVGDILVDEYGNRSVISDIRNLSVSLQWPYTEGQVRLQEERSACSTFHLQSMGQYSSNTQQTLINIEQQASDQNDAKELNFDFISSLILNKCDWTTWEVLNANNSPNNYKALESIIEGRLPEAIPPSTSLKYSFEQDQGNIPFLQALGFSFSSKFRCEQQDQSLTLGLKLMSGEEVELLSSGEVEKPSTLNYRTLKPEPKGLSCPSIFGPIIDYECICGQMSGEEYKNQTCPRCNVQVTLSKERHFRFGHIQLASPVIHPLFLTQKDNALAKLIGITYGELISIIKCQSFLICKTNTDDFKLHSVISEDTYYQLQSDFDNQQYDKYDHLSDEEFMVLELEEFNDISVAMGVEALRRAFSNLGKLKCSQTLGEFVENIFLDTLPVLPSGLRPSIHWSSGRILKSDLNDSYSLVITRNNRVRHLKEMMAPEIIIRNEHKMLQESVNCLFTNGHLGDPITTLEGKPRESLVNKISQRFSRSNLVEKRIQYCGFFNLINNPSLSDEACVLPLAVAIELFRPYLIKTLIENKHSATIRSAKRLVAKGDKKVVEAVMKMADQWPLLIISKSVWTVCRIQIGTGFALALSSQVFQSMNAEVAKVHLPIFQESIKELNERIGKIYTNTEVSPPQKSSSNQNSWFSSLLGEQAPTNILTTTSLREVTHDKLILTALGWPPSKSMRER